MRVVNGILQGNYFTKDKMDSIAIKFDSEERALTGSKEKESYYYNWEGNYHIDVITKALSLSSVNLRRLMEIDNPPSNVTGYIIQIKNHWIALRRILNNWWNLDSLLSNPKILFEFNIKHFIMELENVNKEKASVFFINENIETTNLAFEIENSNEKVVNVFI